MGKEIILFSNSEDPVRLIINNGTVTTLLKNKPDPFRQAQLPSSTSEKPVDVLAIQSLQNPSLWFIRQKPGVTVRSGGKIIKDNGLFGIRCTVDLKNKQTNPPEIGQLIQIAQELGWNIDSYVIALLGMVNN
jgi:hypothetical protein